MPCYYYLAPHTAPREEEVLQRVEGGAAGRRGRRQKSRRASGGKKRKYALTPSFHFETHTLSHKKATMGIGAYFNYLRPIIKFVLSDL